MVSAESEPLADQKNALRGAMRQRRDRLPEADRERAEILAATRLEELPEILESIERRAVLAGYAAVRRELDPARALEWARERGARIAWPRIDDGGRPRLRLHLATGSSSLRPGRFGIPEPDAASLEVAAGEVALMIVPGLAFDRAGHRLGFGGGYYDELLRGEAGAPRPTFVIGLGYDFQLVDDCPANDRDARVDCVVTDARVVRCAAAPAPQPAPAATPPARGRTDA